MPRNPIRVAPIGGQYAITSGYEDRRSYGRHGGIDLAPTGSGFVPALAVNRGQVMRVDRRNDYGNFVDVRLISGEIARYAHLDSVNVRPGQNVNAGTVLGDVGSTGDATGRHLHFELRTGLRQGQTLDPLGFLQNIITPSPQSREMTRTRPTPLGKPIRINTIPRTRPMFKIPVRPRQGIDITDPFAPIRPPQQTPSDLTPAETVGLTGHNLLVGEIAGSIETNPASGQGWLAQGLGITIPTGEEVEDYVQEKAPFVVLAIVGILLITLGAARFVFSKGG